MNTSPFISGNALGDRPAEKIAAVFHQPASLPGPDGRLPPSPFAQENAQRTAQERSAANRA